MCPKCIVVGLKSVQSINHESVAGQGPSVVCLTQFLKGKKIGLPITIPISIRVKSC